MPHDRRRVKRQFPLKPADEPERGACNQSKPWEAAHTEAWVRSLTPSLLKI
jgi:hypothetical protein